MTSTTNSCPECGGDLETPTTPDRPTTTGQRVRRIQARPADFGRTGTVTEIHGTMAGDTLVTVTESNGDTFTAYTRQLQVIS